MNKKDNPKTDFVIVRVTPEQKKALIDAAKIAGVTMSGYILGQTIGDKIGDKILENRSEK